MGKRKYIESPDKLWEYWEAYKQWVKANPIKVHDFVGKDGQEVYRLKERPLTHQRFLSFCAEKFKVTVHHYFTNPDNAYEEYRSICSRIVQEREADQIEGGMAGIYNPSITQRLNNLKEQTEESGSKDVKVVVSYADKPKPTDE